MPLPHVVHRLWLGGEEPAWTRPFYATWERPGWTVQQWGEQEVEALFPLVNQDVFDHAEKIAPNHVGQLRSDVLRYEILWREGGVYADCDFELLKPLDPLIAGAECFACWEVQDKWLANGLIGCTPRHPFMARLIDGLAENVNRERGSKPNRLTGPQYLTRMFREHGEGVTTIDQRLAFPYGWREIERFKPSDRWPVDAVLVHHWHNKRRERGVPVV